MVLKLSQKLLRFCFYSVASIIISLAVALAVLRVALPDLNVYRNDIQKFISENMGYPVEIEEIQARWVGWIPNLDLTSISIFDSNADEAIVHFKNAHIKFDLLTSVSQKSLIPSHIMISGTELTFARLEDGSIIIVESGTNLSKGKGDNQALTNWFKQQNNIILYDTNLTWIDQQNERPPVKFENTFIELSSDEEQIVANGTADLIQGDNPATIDFDIELFGDITSNDWSGTINFNTNEFDLSYLLEQQSLLQIAVGSQRGNGQLKTRFKEAKLNQLAANIQYDVLQIGQGDDSVVINDFEIDLDMLHRIDGQWITDISFQNKTDEDLIYDGTAIRAITEIDELNNHHKIDLTINYLPLKNIVEISKHIPEFDEFNLSEILSDGELHNLQVSYQTEKDFFTNERNTNNLTINLSEATLDSPKLYKQAKSFNNLESEFEWVSNDDENQITINNLFFNTKDFPIQLSGMINPELDNYVDLNLEIQQVALASLPEYLPITANEPLTEWVNRGLVSGTANNLNLTAKGPIAKFPYPDDKDGELRLVTKIKDAIIDYEEDWPLLEKLSGELNLAGTRLQMQVENGDIMSASINDLNANIPDILLDDPNLFIKGNVSAKGEMLAGFIDESPLKDRKSLEIIKQINLKGPTEVKLDLNIPLYPEALTEINGILSFLGNSINSEELNMQMSEFKGDIHFTRETVTAEGITANYFDRIVNLTIPRVQADESEYIVISGEMDDVFIKQQIAHYVPDIIDEINPYLDYITGNGDWQAHYSLAVDNENEILYISSDLHGIALQFPKPLNKSDLQLLPLTLEIPLTDTKENFLKFQLENLLLANLKYTNGDDSELNSLAIMFGNQAEQFTASDRIELRGDIKEFELSSWLDVVYKADEEIGETPFDATSIFNNKFSEVTVGTVHFEGQQYKNVSATLNQTQGNWDIIVNSDNITGSILIPYDIDSIEMNLSQLKLEKNQQSNETTEILDPTTFPLLNANVQEFYYNNAPLGQLSINMSRLDNGISIDQLVLNSEKVQANSFGKWTIDSNQTMTDLSIELNATSINEMREHFSFEKTSIEDGKITIKMDGNWTGSPMDFELENLNGNLNMDIEQGNILDIDPKAGRLFGLLSIQSLPRRLSLDFSDLFGEGLHFDDIKGNFSITDGQAFTNDLIMRGPTAQIAVSGRTGLVAQDYDQIVTVNPNVNSTLPVAGAIFGPVGIGVGAAIYFAGELFDTIPTEIGKLLQIKYTITGSWDDPIVEKYVSQENIASEESFTQPSSIGEAIKK